MNMQTVTDRDSSWDATDIVQGLSFQGSPGDVLNSANAEEEHAHKDNEHRRLCSSLQQGWRMVVRHVAPQQPRDPLALPGLRAFVPCLQQEIIAAFTSQLTGMPGRAIGSLAILRPVACMGNLACRSSRYGHGHALSDDEVCRLIPAGEAPLLPTRYMP